jgi:hypothetical protein
MKKLLSMAAVAGIVAAFAAPAQADEFVARYTYLVNGAPVPTAATVVAPSTTVLTQPAVIENTITTPAVVSKPIMVEHHENLVPHIFHLGLWPLVDFSIF